MGDGAAAGFQRRLFLLDGGQLFVERSIRAIDGDKPPVEEFVALLPACVCPRASRGSPAGFDGFRQLLRLGAVQRPAVNAEILQRDVLDAVVGVPLADLERDVRS